MKKGRTYSGQAIAIIMVVLVVATVIGASLYSRMIKNRNTLTETRESSRALEQADSILDLVISSDLGAVQGYFEICLAGGKCEYNNLDQFVDAFGGALSPDMYNSISDEWCESDNDPSSSISISVEYADIDDYQEWDVGSVMALKVGGLGIPSVCPLSLGFTSASSQDALFTIKRVYANTTGVKAYEENDMLLYCFATDGSCSAPVAPGTSIARTFTPSSNTIEIDLGSVIGGYPLYEIRVLPLYEKIGISIGVPECAAMSLHNYKVNAKVNCKGDYREKEVIIPNVNNLGYPSLFDYTIYNATGVLKPN